MAIHGVIVALLTTFDDSGIKLDLARLQEHVEFLLENRVHGLFTTGTAGEGILLESEERKKLLSAVVNAVRKRVPIIAHVGHVVTDTAIELAEHARDAGADAVASVPPYYFPLDDEALLDYFHSVAKAAAPLPFYVYNYPGATNNTISISLLGRLVQQIPNFAGIKDSSKSLDCFFQYLESYPGMEALIGSDTLALEAFQSGGAGVISTVANVFPAEVVKIYESFRTKQEQTAEQAQLFVNEARKILKQGPYISTYKAALSQLYGKNLGGCRKPLRNVNEAELETLKHSLESLNIFREKVMK